MSLQDWVDVVVFFVKLGVEWLVIFTAAVAAVRFWPHDGVDRRRDW